jgi:hypothetical protein
VKTATHLLEEDTTQPNQGVRSGTISFLFPIFFLHLCLPFIFLNILFILCWVGVHYSIYKSSYSISNISYLKHTLFYYPLSPTTPHTWRNFNRYHFCIYLHVYTVFTLHSPSHTVSLPPLSPPHLSFLNASITLFLQVQESAPLSGGQHLKYRLSPLFTQKKEICLCFLP